MSKQLILVRHAKADWSMREFNDLNRTLNASGYQEILDITARERVTSLRPQLIISSHAVRALSTAQAFLNTWQDQDPNPSHLLELKIEPAIYEASLQQLWQVIHALPTEVDKIALIGHNPGFTYLAVDLANLRMMELPTCGLLVLEFEASDWKSIQPKTGKLVFYEF
ncbi:MAG: hypothetical protein EOO99_10030 [Pedobacter sp.]|nr:MAG: hypothetical protein EOO99_10030 [Pedobacter sp.]